MAYRKTQITGIIIGLMLLITGMARASDIIIGTVTLVEVNQRRLGIEIIRTNSKNYSAGTTIYLDVADIGQLKKGQAVRAAVSCAEGKNACRAEKIDLLKKCWRRDKTGVRYRLNRAMRHRRGPGRHGRGCPRGHRGR